MHVSRLGSGPRAVLVHGSVANGAATWEGQLRLADRYELVVPDRPGFPPNPPVERLDFEEQAPLIAELLGDGAHLVGHSTAASSPCSPPASRPDVVRSLVLLEPPAVGVASGNAAVDAFAAAAQEHWRSGPAEPRAFLEGF